MIQVVDACKANDVEQQEKYQKRICKSNEDKNLFI